MLEALAHVINVVRRIGTGNLHHRPYSVTFNNVLIISTGALLLQFYRMECGCFAWHFTCQWHRSFASYSMIFLHTFKLLSYILLSL
jgi:hypothetical protein